MNKICIDCQQEFQVGPDKEWAKRCLSCWRKNKQNDALYQLQQENLILRNEIMLLRQRLPLVTRGLTAPEGFGEIIKTLIQLCHPDKHDNSAAANRATQWLLTQRQKNTRLR
jgi:hypothetical protein